MSAPSILPGDNNMEKLASLCNLTYQQQVTWFINAYWEDFAEEKAEQFWLYVHKCVDLDIEKHEQGTALDELNAHRFLEHFDLTMTVREMRTKLRNTGAVEQNFRFKNVPISHMLIGLHDIDWNELVNAPQGDNKEEIDKATALLEEVQEAFRQSEARAQEAATALAESKSKEAAAKAREAEAKAAAEEAKAKEAAAKAAADDAKKAEAAAHAAAEEAKKDEAAAYAAAEEAKVKEQESIAAKAELEAALAELKAQEDAYNQKTEDLKRKSEEGGVVSRNRAKNELAQHLGEDPLPLRRAKIDQEAAVRKAERAAKAAAEAVTASEQAAAKASEAVTASEQAKQAAEAAVDAAREKVAEAEAFLEEVKSKPGQAQGAIWWMERELYEKRKYLPESKGGIRK
eukprot:TRINITY_DN134_c0_g1_i11.p1 TRINITY_DN134_c0_g1~~TRINITY_DN134_c0_g1_i11.p1  ORF type:complete len:401 (+),score=260.49 TRINITY_DN134_c0_g1_i11:63-1265(+)